MFVFFSNHQPVIKDYVYIIWQGQEYEPRGGFESTGNGVVQPTQMI